MSETQQDQERFLDRITELHLAVGLSVLGVVTMALGTCAAYDTSGALPPPGPAPKFMATEKLAVVAYRYKPGFFRSVLDDDVKKLGLERIGPETLRKPTPYRQEFSGTKKMKLGDTHETESLAIEAVGQQVRVGDEGSSYRSNHLLLKITNKTNKYFAYKIRTSIKSKKCKDKGILPHNALALAPERSVLRTECLMPKDEALTLESVELLELTALGYHYVSRIDPLALELDRRTTEGHQTGKLGECKVLPWRLIEEAVEANRTSWYDVVDFYARHNCDEYSFFVGYQWTPRGPHQLPMAPPKK